MPINVVQIRSDSVVCVERRRNIPQGIRLLGAASELPNLERGRVMTLPQRLKYLRLAESACGKKLPMSQKELGAKMGRNEWVVSKMELGVHASLSEQNLTRWKQAMGLERYAWLLTCGSQPTFCDA